MSSEDFSLTCEHASCGTQFEAPRRRKYCTPLCERRAYSARRKADGRLAESRRSRADKIAAYNRANADKYRVERECLACGRAWMTARKDARYCSFNCRGLMAPGVKACAVPDDHPARMGLVCVVPARHPARQTQPASGSWVMGWCKRCAAAFVVADNRREAAYCSEACLRRDCEDKRRAMLHAAFVEHVARARVFDRDGWVCGLCGEETARLAKVPHPLSPVVDHIKSLANGGTHEMANVQCAHFLCNSIKGDRDHLYARAA